MDRHAAWKGGPQWGPILHPTPWGGPTILTASQVPLNGDGNTAGRVPTAPYTLGGKQAHICIPRKVGVPITAKGHCLPWGAASQVHSHHAGCPYCTCNRGWGVSLLLFHRRKHPYCTSRSGGGGILHPRALRGVSSLHPNKPGAGGLPVLSLPRGREGVPTTPEVGSRCLATAGIPTASPQSGTRVLSTPGMCPPSSLPRLPRGPGACPPAQN